MIENMPIYFNSTCKLCKKPYRGFGRYFCSDSCKIKFFWKQGKYKNRKTWNKGTKGVMQKNSGSFISEKMTLDNHPLWKGGRIIDEKGYVRIRIGDNQWQYEHRFVIEKSIGRKLEKKEHIHHLNGDKSDNRIENLQLLHTSIHNKLHAKNQWKNNPPH